MCRLALLPVRGIPFPLPPTNISIQGRCFPVDGPPQLEPVAHRHLARICGFGGGPLPGRVHKTALKSLQRYSSCYQPRGSREIRLLNTKWGNWGTLSGGAWGAIAQLPLPLPSCHGLLPVLDASLSLRVSAGRLPFPPSPWPASGPRPPSPTSDRFNKKVLFRKGEGGWHRYARPLTWGANRPPSALDSSCARDGGVGGLIRGGEEAGGGGRGGAWQLAVVPSERTSCGCVVRVSPVGPGRHQLPRGEEAEAAAWGRPRPLCTRGCGRLGEGKGGWPTGWPGKGKCRPSVASGTSLLGGVGWEG